MMARVEEARREWQRFEREDRPAFARWMAATFGALLTRLRELETQALEKETLVAMIQTEIMFTGDTPHRAYQRIMKARANPHPETEAGQDEDSSDPWAEDESDFEGSSDPNEDEDREMFEETLRGILGVDPDDLDKASYDRMFQEFKQQVLGKSGPETPPPFAGRPGMEAPPPKDIRVKELYRVLVRRLHPDMRADNDASVSALWHEVQEAYEAGNLDRLEMLLALTDLESNQTGPHTTLFQLKAALAELGRSLRALQKSLRAARRDQAWNFARTSDRTGLQNRLRRELESAQAEQQAHLDHLERLLALWSTSPAGRKRKPRRAERPQEEFFF
jgi:hypothetical protein